MKTTEKNTTDDYYKPETRYSFFSKNSQNIFMSIITQHILGPMSQHLLFFKTHLE